jgi:F0F1-type ATP synthase membrane subunit a
MEDIAPSLPHQLVTVPGGFVLTYQYATIFMAVCVVALLALVSVAWTRRVKMIPGRGQAVLELAVGALRDLCYATMGPKDGRAYLPLIGTIFLFVWVSNMFVLIPTAEIFKALTGRTDLYLPLFGHTLIIPGVQEPSRNVNFPWGLGIMVFFIMHIGAVLRKGPAHYFAEYFEPRLFTFRWRLDQPKMRFLAAAIFAVVWGGIAWFVAWVAGGAGLVQAAAGAGMGLFSLVWCLVRLSHTPKMVGFPNPLIMPLNVIGKGAEILSMCFRLFGNIFGGAVIITLLSGMTRHIGLPLILQGFIGVFTGTIQAFVFTMLSLTYIAVELGAGEEGEGHDELHEDEVKADRKNEELKIQN